MDDVEALCWAEVGGGEGGPGVGLNSAGDVWAAGWR